MDTEIFIKELKDRNEIVSTISEYVKVKNSQDKYYAAECIFSEEKSLILIDRENQTYFNLRTGCGGDVIDFVSKYKEQSITETINELAKKVELEIPELDFKLKIKERNTTLKINEEATYFYYNSLATKNGVEAQKYLKNRALSKETIKAFWLGYAPGTWDALTKHIMAKGYSQDEMLRSGLFTQDEQGKIRDKFVNRVMFPIQNEKGEVVAFGGRVLDDSKPKYLNSPETAAFIKSENLYGWNKIKDSKTGDLIICEGYMDVIAMQQAGFTQACASLGTAFTNQQAQILGKYTKNVFLAYDSDEAGIKAAVKNIEILRRNGLNGKVIDMKPYKDPDEFIKNLGKDEFQKRIDTAKDGYIFLLEMVGDKNSDEFKSLASQILIEEKEDRSLLLEKICNHFNVDGNELKKNISDIASKPNKSSLLQGSLDDILLRVSDTNKKDHKKVEEPTR